MVSKTPGDMHPVALSDIHYRRLLVALQEYNPQGVYETHIPEDVHTGEEELGPFGRELFHTYLPKLEEIGFVQRDKATEIVTKDPRFEGTRPVWN